MPEALGDDLHRNPSGKGERRTRVAKSVEGDRLHAGFVDEARKDTCGQVREDQRSAELRRTARKFHGEDEGAVLVRAPVPELQLGLGASVKQERVNEGGREIERARPAALERNERPATELVNDPDHRTLGVEVLPLKSGNLALTEPEFESERKERAELCAGFPRYGEKRSRLFGRPNVFANRGRVYEISARAILDECRWLAGVVRVEGCRLARRLPRAEAGLGGCGNQGFPAPSRGRARPFDRSTAPGCSKRG